MESKNPLKSAIDDKETKGVPDYYLGIAHARTRAMQSAIKAWEDASRKGLSVQIIRDDMVNIYRQLVPVYFDKGNLNKVIKIWERLLELSPGDLETRKNLVHAYFLHGNEYAKAENYKSAIKHWEKAWNLDPSNPDISHNLALAYEKQKQSAMAMNYWQETVKGWKLRISANPSEKETLKARLHSAHTHLGAMALEIDNLGRAISEYREALRYDPEDLDSIVKLANLYIIQRNPRSAIKELEKARRIAPKDLDVLHQMSIAYALDKNILRSVECIREILRIDPSNETYKELLCNYYIDRAKEARKRERYEAALKFLDEGLEILPNNIDILALFGGIYLDMDEPDKAEDTFKKIIQMNQSNYRSYLAVASHYLESHMRDKAELYFAQAISINPDEPDIYIEIAREYCKVDMCQLANEYYEKAKNKKPGDSETLIKIITILLNKSCSDFALKYAEELLKYFPDLPRAYYLMASAY
ncbi:tetratricopeptide repeat protein, partial [Candidatus Poribacteria bacterium]|nr:tetratricopeptide repeat protein [Candidatus Poribacteria bacterium]